MLGIVTMLWSSVFICTLRRPILMMSPYWPAYSTRSPTWNGRSNMIVIPAMKAATRSRIAKPTAKASAPPMTVSAVGSRRMLSPTVTAATAM